MWNERSKWTCQFWTLVALLLASSLASAAEPRSTVVVGGLKDPCGVAIQPETWQVFVAESGAGRIVRIIDGKPQDVITGFGKADSATVWKIPVGPLGLAFAGRETLVVGGGELPAGQDLVRFFTVPAPGAPPLTVAAADPGLALPATEAAAGEGDFFSLAWSGEALYLTCLGDESLGWVAKGIRQGPKIEKLERFVATRKATGVPGPGSLTLSPRGELVVAQIGSLTTPGDATVSFYSSKDGRLLLHLKCGLHDVVALGYSAAGQLYALDFAASKPEDAGLYHLAAVLEDGRQSLKPRKLLSVDRPTALANAPDGTLYVTSLGKAATNSNSSSGSLLKVEIGK